MQNDPATMGGMPDAWSIYLASDDAQATVDAAVANGGGVMCRRWTIPAHRHDGLRHRSRRRRRRAVPGDRRHGVRLRRRGRRRRRPGSSCTPRTSTPTVALLREGVRLGHPRRWATPTSSATRRSARATTPEGRRSWTPSAFLPEGVPAHWSVYFRVADADATVAKVDRARRRRSSMPAEDTPYGRLATVADPNGARFRILGPNTA